MDQKEFENKATEIRNKLIELNKEAKALAKSGKTIGGCFDIPDFDGDVEETATTLGDAYERMNELDGVISSMFYFLKFSATDVVELP